MDFNTIQQVTTPINAGPPVDQQEGFPFATPTADLNGRVQSFNGRVNTYNAEVTTYNDNSVEYRKDKKDLAGLDTAVKVMMFIAIAAIIAFVVLACLPMAIPMIAFPATAIAAGGGILLASILEIAHAVTHGKVKEGEERFAPQSAILTTAELHLTTQRADLEAEINTHNQQNPLAEATGINDDTSTAGEAKDGE